MKACEFNRNRPTSPLNFVRSRDVFSDFANPTVRMPRQAGFAKTQDASELLVARPSAEQLIIVVQAGMDSEAPKAFLYASKPLSDEDFEYDFQNKRVVTVRSAQFIVEQQLDANWYKVRRKRSFADG